MNILKNIFVILLLSNRILEYQLDDYFELEEYSDTYISDSVSVLPISYGHLTYYNTFVNMTFTFSKRNKSSVCMINRRNNLMPLCLLLCGDVHPCPGPSTSDNSPSTHETEYKVFQKRGLHFLHINVRSLIPKLHEVERIAKTTRAACICISETWLDISVPDSEIAIHNYYIQRRDRNRHGGGVCIYVRKDLSFNIRNDLDHTELEAKWIELFLPKSKPILVGVIYRPPSQQNFYTILDVVCSSSSDFLQYETFLLGDFNTDVSCPRTIPLVQCFNSFINMFNFTKVINEPTRICSTSSTTIDLILVSDCHKISQSGVIHTAFSDHCMVYCTRKVTKSFIGSHNNIILRSLKNYNKDDFQAKLLSVDWNSVILSDNVNDAWFSFKKLFLSAIDSIAPLKQIRIKQRSNPWMNANILQAINDRDKAFHKYTHVKSEENFNSFQMFRNKVQNLVYSAKKDYFTNSIEQNKNDSKSLWKTLKSLGLPSKKGSDNSSSNICLKIDGNICFDKKLIADTFNNFYTTVACKLVEKLPKCVQMYGCSFVNQFYAEKGVFPNSYSFSLISESKVLKYLTSLSAHKATGLDGIPSHFIKDGSSIIAGPLTHIINLSLIQGIVPDDLKSARVVPLYKKNDKLSVGNYRPVSILNIVSKIFERVVYDQVETYFKDRDLLYKFQSGFRGGFSTDTCLIHLTDYIRNENDKGNFVGMLLLDLQKAFDTVDHSILLMKLKAAGLGNDILRWFSSYLCDRQQLVDVSGTFSSTAQVTCGVPQGSILGPLLFIIYVNDMSAVVKNKLLLYADDSAILVSDKCFSNVEQVLIAELQSVSQWLVDNKLSLHLGKTESIVFGSKQKLRSKSSLNISCNGTEIESTKSVKYLGVTLDQHLSFSSMADSVLKKANARLKFLYRKKEFLTHETKKLLVMSLIQCHFDYGCSIWYNSLTQAFKNKLQTTQNKILRFVLNLDSRTHIGFDHFRYLNWLPVEKRVQHLMLCHMFKVRNNEAPGYMNDYFVAQDSVHEYNTRLQNKGGYCLPKVKGSGSKSFSFLGSKLWNNLPSNITRLENIKHFKVATKSYLMTNV